MTGILGSISGMKERFSKHMENGEKWKATEDFVPSTIRNLMRGLRWVGEGVRSDDGEFIFEPTTAEIVKKVMGVPVAREKRAMDLRYTTGKLIDNMRSKAALYNTRIAKAYLDGDLKRVQEIFEEVRNYNLDKNPAYRIQVSMNSIKYKLQEMKYGKQDTYIPRRLRGEVKKMREGG